jgi:hypothetical protein
MEKLSAMGTLHELPGSAMMKFPKITPIFDVCSSGWRPLVANFVAEVIWRLPPNRDSQLEGA